MTVRACCSSLPALLAAALAAQRPAPLALVTAPPKAEVERLRLDPFYRRYVSAGGLPVVASAAVSPYTLLEARHLIARMLDGRDDILHKLIENKVRFSINSDVASYELRLFPKRKQADQTSSSEPLHPNEMRKGFQAILDNRPPGVAAYYALLYLTGMRANELADTSSWEFIDGDRPLLRVYNPKNATTRNVTFEACPTAASLVRTLEARAETPRDLFPHDGVSFSQSVRDYERLHLRKQLGFKFNAHRMRSSCGTYAMLLGIPDSLMCRRMDHTAQTALLHYRVGAEVISPVEGAKTLEEAAGLSGLFEQIVENLRA